MTAMTQTQLLVRQEEPGWRLERQGSALLLMRDSDQREAEGRRQRVCFRCDVEVREYEREEEPYVPEVELTTSDSLAASPLAMCASCLAALCVTLVLPWLLIGG